MRYLGDAQACAIRDRQGRLMLQAGRGFEQPLHLLKRQDHRDLAGMRGPDQLAREVGPVERVRKEEPQRRDDAVHRRCGHAGILLLDLELAKILGRRGVRRAPQPRRETSDVADIVALRLVAEPAHGHVVDQPLTQRAGGNNGYQVVHRSTPRVEGVEMFCPGRAPLNPGEALGGLT